MSSPGPGSPSGDPLAQLGTIVFGEQPLPQILELVVHLAKRALRPTVEASLTLVDGHGPQTVAFTGELALTLDERQYEDDTGPCLDAAAGVHTIVVADTRREDRWPRYAEAAAIAGVRSSLSMRLPIPQLTGALNFYAANPGAFDAETIGLAEAFARNAAFAVANAYLYQSAAGLAEQRQQAMASRAVVEQAKGLLMRDHSYSAEDAFDMLVRTSQQSHIKIRQVAQRLVDSVTADDTD